MEYTVKVTRTELARVNGLIARYEKKLLKHDLSDCKELHRSPLSEYDENYCGLNYLFYSALVGYKQIKEEVEAGFS